MINIKKTFVLGLAAVALAAISGASAGVSTFAAAQNGSLMVQHPISGR